MDKPIPSPAPNNKHNHNWKDRLYVVIFGTDTPLGKAFDLLLLIFILLSILVVMLESVQEIEQTYGKIIKIAEWTFTIVFTIEYILRIITTNRPKKYIFSFFGIIDFLAVIPTYLTIIFAGSQYLLVVRAIRLIRVFRILKLSRYLGESKLIADALKASREKIVVFLGAVLTLATIMGTLMYLVESPDDGFTSIPRSVYWAIVTLTTVGYGDIAPQTVIGQILASIIMIMGYSIIAVPTGIVTSELVKGPKKKDNEITCSKCNQKGHDTNASFCKYCGTELIKI
ncbi:MAG: ion transporter [Bacteroidetes bacterium]|nr:ion transporter [Bacteroidota bacterium]